MVMNYRNNLRRTLVGARVAARLVVLAVLGAAGAVQAQDQVELSAEQLAAVEWAQARGRLLYRYDQAAWHGTDAFLEDFQSERDGPSMRGYIVVKGEGDLLDTIFFGEIDGELREFARYAVDGSEVVAGEYFAAEGRPLLSAHVKRLAHVRQVAIEALVNQGLGLCANAAPNTVVLPPDAAGNIEVYVLTPPVSSDSYPLGGHYRFNIGPDNEVTDWRRFMNSCFEIPMGGMSQDGEEPVGAGITHFLDPQPTEIHFLASAYVGLQLHVITTDNRLVWTIVQGETEGAVWLPE